MIARAEMLTNAQSTEPQSSAPTKGMSVALIGPNDAHRQVVARALASAQGRKVHEFIDYPASLNDLPRMVESNFDVVLVDVDTDESYALQIIAKLADMGTAVMAYSARTDQDLLMSCMRAGARDFLPLPTEENQPPAELDQPQEAAAPQSKAIPAAPQPPASKSPVAATSQPTPRPTEPKAPPTPAAPASRLNVTPIIPQKFAEPEREPWPARVPEARSTPAIPNVSEEAKSSEELDILKPEAKSDFAAWDAANLRRSSMPPVTRPDPRPRPALVPEKRKGSEPIPRVVPSPEPVVEIAAATPAPAPPIERPPVSTEIFRSALFQSEPNEAAEKQGANWVKWILIAAGPVVLALVLLVVFTRPSSNSAAAAAKVAPAPAPAKADTSASASDRLIVNATGKPSASVPATSKIDAGQADSSTSGSASQGQNSAPVSPDAMAAQLVAPSRIAGRIKAAAGDEPPAAPAPVSLDDNNSVPGSVFGTSKLRAVPRVVPISAGVADGMLIHRTTPVYPKFAQDAHITGTVTLKATITKQGTIEGIQVVSGPKILAPAAVDAVKTWKYRPYMLDGQPISVETNVTIVFGSR